MYRFKPLNILTMLVAVLLSSSVFAADPQADIKAQFQKSFPQVKLKEVSKTPVEGVYQVVTGSGELLYASSDGKHLFTGDMLRMEAMGSVNVSEKWRSTQRVASLKELKDGDLVVYPAKGEEKGEVLVFTDTSCGYCRKFHTEIPAINEMGITVKYVAWPRYGVQSPAGQTMVNVWCAADRSAAMTEAKSNKPVSAPPAKVCDQNVLQDQINLGQRIGVRGTPAVFTPSGRQLGGYVKADQLAQQMGVK